MVYDGAENFSTILHYPLCRFKSCFKPFNNAFPFLLISHWYLLMGLVCYNWPNIWFNKPGSNSYANQILTFKL